MKKPHVRSRRVFRKKVEATLFPPTVEELVPKDHLVRRLKGLVEHAVGKTLRALYEDHGGVPYDPVSLLAVELYGLMLGIRSSRQLEELCRFDARFWFLTGSLKPDHMTLCRFRRRLADHLPELFAKVLDVAREEGLLGMKVVVVDGTKIAGNVSQWRKVLAQAEDADSNLVDADASLMFTRNSGTIKGYNAQVAVDQQHRLIVGQTVSRENNDGQQMPAVLDSVEECAGELPERAVADAGYDSAENHRELEEREVEGYVVQRDSFATFWKLDDEDRPVCPAGHVAKPSGTFNLKGRIWQRLRVSQCETCPMKAACGVKGHKCINSPVGVSPAARIRNGYRVESLENRGIMRSRAPTVETVFAQMKGNRKLRKFRYKGLRLVQMEFGLECLTYNVERVLGLLLSLIWLKLAFRARAEPPLTTFATVPKTA
jgi:transposase